MGGFPLDLGVPGATSFKLVLSRSGHFVGSGTYATWGPDSLTTNLPGGITGSMTRTIVVRLGPGQSGPEGAFGLRNAARVVTWARD